MLKEISDAQDTPNEAASFDTYGAMNTGVSASDIKKGFIAESMEIPADQEGNTREGNPYERAGFLAGVMSDTR